MVVDAAVVSLKYIYVGNIELISWAVQQIISAIGYYTVVDILLAV